MNEIFRAAVEGLESKYRALMQMAPIHALQQIPSREPVSGVYMFSEGNKHLYVGRSKRIRARYSDHTRDASDMNSAPFAMLLAREVTGISRVYSGELTRRNLSSHPEFGPAFLDAKRRIRSMSFRYVEEADPLTQTLLECYVAIAVGASHNSFETH